MIIRQPTPELVGYLDDIRRELHATQIQRNVLLEDVAQARALLREVVGLVDEMPPDLVERIDAALLEGR